LYEKNLIAHSCRVHEKIEDTLTEKRNSNALLLQETRMGNR